MIATIRPSRAEGTMTAPPSKSMAHRMILCAGLADNSSTVGNVDASEDILATMDCLRALGAEILYADRTAVIRGTDPRRLKDSDCDRTKDPGPGMPGGRSTNGVQENAAALSAVLRCRESGSTLRFLLPLCLLSGRTIQLTGSRKLFTRPLSVYRDLCREQGLLFAQAEDSVTVAGRLEPGQYRIPGNLSSQFISGLLFALPLLPGDSEITLEPPVESRPYIEMTMQALEEAGIRTAWRGPCTILVPGGQAYSPVNTSIEGDYSNAAFFDALNLLGGDVRIEGLREDSLQGDQVYRELFGRIRAGAAAVRPDHPAAGTREGVRPDHPAAGTREGVRPDRPTAGTEEGVRPDHPAAGTEGYVCPDRPSAASAGASPDDSPAPGPVRIDLSDCPDLGPVLMAAAALFRGAVFTGTRRLKIKESDRGEAMRQELSKMGVRMDVLENEIRVFPGLHPPGGILDGHNDHRIVMALSVLLTKTGGSICGAEAVKKSLPDFFERLGSLGIDVELTKN